jgi:hypothetical protein
MSERGMIECVLKTGLEEAIKKDGSRPASLKSGVADGYYVNLWLKDLAASFLKRGTSDDE